MHLRAVIFCTAFKENTWNMNMDRFCLFFHTAVIQSDIQLIFVEYL